MTNTVGATVGPGQSSNKIVVGKHADKLMLKVPPDARSGVISESLRVLERASITASTDQARTSAQLIVGEVQSGKTLSFTTVMALARDNRYPLIVVVAGTKNNLLAQTEVRLINDLNLNGDGGANPWRTWRNPSIADVDNLRQLLVQWSDPSVPDRFRQTAVLFVLKHAKRLDAVAELLDSILVGSNSSAVKALIIDDEADQASLNLRASKGEESSIYAAAQRMRSSLKNHTYLMYTATPQAPLLVSIADTLSPDTVTVLTAGEDYVGGRELFEDNKSNYIRRIDPVDLEIALDPDSETPPETLTEALAFWTLALVIAQERETPRPLTMLVHPAATRDLHAKYDSWVRAILQSWKGPLFDPTDIAYEELLDDVFIKAYQDLARTVPGLPDPKVDRSQLDDMLQLARYYLNQIEQRIVNSATQAEIPEQEWKKFPGWIVIGGNKLDRGFTVQNLCVTYMPRGKGVGNADTIQQRGRFFGYKRKYLDLLRGWFSDGVANAFGSYVEHERTMQKELRAVDNNDATLKDWKRKFLLDPELKLTRKQVMSLPTVSSIVGRGWTFQQVELADPKIREINTTAALSLIDLCKQHGEQHPMDDRPARKRHLLASWEFEDALHLLYNWECSGPEREELDKLVFALTAILDDSAPVPGVDVIAVDSGQPRIRTLQDVAGVQRITNLFQGRGSTGGYVGDSKFASPQGITIQLHMIDVVVDKAPQGVTPALAVALPEDSERRVYWGV